jgi:hypothetical protein
MRIWDQGWKKFDPGSGMEKSRIRDKHPGSATLECTIFWVKIMRIHADPDPQPCQNCCTKLFHIFSSDLKFARQFSL